jgi:hydrogenase maturation protease
VHPVILIALGNPLMSDEGIGVLVLERLRSSSQAALGIDLLDSGNSGMRILHALEGRRKAVFVDCAFMDAEPGTMRRFLFQEAASRKDLPGFSLHEGDLLQTLELADRLGTLPGKTVIFGIEPQSVEPGPAVTTRLQDHLDEYIRTIQAELGS